MPTRMRRAMRRSRRILNRLEPLAILFAYIAVGGMAISAWYFPPVSAKYVPHTASTIEGWLLFIGFILCMLGHIRKIEILETLGLICTLAGSFVFLSILVNLLLVVGYVPIVQMIFVTMVAMSFMWWRTIKHVDDIFNLRLSLPSRKINKIYSEQR